MIKYDDITNIILENNSQIDVKNLDNSLSLLEQGLDSLDMMSLFFEIEKRYNKKIPDSLINEKKIHSIHEILNFINDITN
jgi:acyl carrier protein